MKPRLGLAASALLLSLAGSSLLAGSCWAQTADPAGVAAWRAVVDPQWPKKPDGVAWGPMPGIAVDSHDCVYLFTRKQPAVQVFRTDGTLVRSWSPTIDRGAHGIRVDRQGNVWLTDFLRHVIEKYSPEGTLLLTLGEPGRRGSDSRHFDGPTDMAILSGGDVFISDGYGNRRIIQFDKQGSFVKQWGGDGDAPGQFALPHAIVADSQERLYVADRNNGRIQVFDTAGRLLANWDDLLMPWGLWMTAGDELWVCGSSRVRKSDVGSTGKASGSTSQAKSESHGVPWQVAPPPDQWLLKLSREGKVLLRAPLAKAASTPGKPGEVDWVHAVAIDSQGAVYLGDIEGKRAQKYLLSKP